VTTRRTLPLTSSGGTFTTQVFTDQTMSRNGGSGLAVLPLGVLLIVAAYYGRSRFTR
jgi:hypothetical protein